MASAIRHAALALDASADSFDFPEKIRLVPNGGPKKDITVRYLYRAESNIDRIRKDGRPVYKQTLQQMQSSSMRCHSKIHSHAIDMHSGEKRHTMPFVTIGRRPEKLVKADIKEQSALALNKSLVLPSDRVRERDLQKAAVAREFGDISVDISIPGAPAEVREKASLRDLFKCDDTSVDRSPEFNLNFITPKGPEFTFVEAKQKKGKKRGARSLAKNTLPARTSKTQSCGDGSLPSISMVPSECHMSFAKAVTLPHDPDMDEWQQIESSMIDETTEDDAPPPVVFSVRSWLPSFW